MPVQNFSPIAPAHSLSVLVCDDWLDDFCEEVGSLSATLQSLSRNDPVPDSQGAIAESLARCAALQELLNEIPVWSVGPATHGRWTQASRGHSAAGAESEVVSTYAEEPDWAEEQLGDCFPELAIADEEFLPAFGGEFSDAEGDRAESRKSLYAFHERAADDLRQLELMSLGRDWLRLSRLAGALKNAAARVSAYRIVADASALQSAARSGCRRDVDVTLDALRRDVQECPREIGELNSV